MIYIGSGRAKTSGSVQVQLYALATLLAILAHFRKDCKKIPYCDGRVWLRIAIYYGYQYNRAYQTTKRGSKVIKLLNTQNFIKKALFENGTRCPDFLSMDLFESSLDAPEILPAGSSTSWNNQIDGNIGFITPCLRQTA